MSKGFAVAAIFLIATFSVGSMGSLHASAATQFPQTISHPADESMAPAEACSAAVSCAGTAQDDAECADRCLSAASATSRSTMPTLPSLGAALLLLAAFGLIAPYAEKRYATSGIDRILLRQRLATIVLRN